ncbi:unnamed protein product [Sphagnum troendelagicum]|uniref:HAT C-terminal dimerisation domain-containing protein n=1 Tax=Sphagnum troendelagicum TaxID=128251 RepID=A0ABP0UCK6_9BRYO
MTVLQTIARFGIGISNSIAAIEAERDRANNPSDDLASPVMLKELVTMRSSTFITDIIEPLKEQLQANAWTADQINAIEVEHRELLAAYKRDSGVASIINEQDVKTTFNEAWGAVGSERCHQLPRFCAGLATVFPNSTSVESDFSILKWELDEFRTSLLDLSLKGIFQAKQFEVLDRIAQTLDFPINTAH